MKDGHVVQIGTPEEIIDEPANDYIVDFIQDIDRSKVFQASHVMIEPRVTAKLNETLNVVARKMRDSSLSSLFILDDANHVKGIVTIDDAVKGIKKDRSIQDVLKIEIEIVDEDDYVIDLITYDVYKNDLI